MAVRSYQVANACWPGFWDGGLFYPPGSIVLLDVSIPNKAPKWSGAGVTPGVRGWIAPKLLSLDAGGAADLATYCATLSTQASEATVSDSMYPLGGIGG